MSTQVTLVAVAHKRRATLAALKEAGLDQDSIRLIHPEPAAQ